MAGEREEHVVEGRAAQADVVDLDASGVEVPDDLGEQFGAAGDRDGQFAGVLGEGYLALAQVGENGPGRVDLVGLMDDDLDALAAGLGLELVGGAAGDDEAVVDDADVVRQAVGLLQVLGGQQERRAACDEFLDDLPQLLPVARVEAGRRLVHEHHRRGDDERRRQVEAAAHPSGVRLRRPVGRVGEVEPFQQLARPGLRVAPAHLVELTDHLQVLTAGQILVDRGELAGEPDRAADVVGSLQYVDARHDRPAAVRPEQSRQDTYGGRLAGPVGAEEAQDRAFRHVEINTAECSYIAEGLHQAFGMDGAWHTDSPRAFG